MGSSRVSFLFFVSLFVSFFVVAFAGNFYQDFDLTWGDNRAKIYGRGDLLTLSLDKVSGSGFRSKKDYLFGRLDMQIKLTPGNSAGTVTTFYLSSDGPNHDEIDFEFLGNLSGSPYTLHTNLYAQGVGNREQEFFLWFDPTKNFHTYSVVWSPQRVIFMVDNIPIRVFNNFESYGVPFPKKQPMKIYSSFWNADQWATRGGREKTDWSKAPFTAFYRNFNANACVWSWGSSSCIGNSNTWQRPGFDANQRRRLRWVRKNFMTYDYCRDWGKFRQGRPKECRLSRTH